MIRASWGSGHAPRSHLRLARPALAEPCSAVLRMSESLRLTIVYEAGEDGWVVAAVPEVPGALSQGRTRAEARTNVIEALRGILELRFGEHAPAEPAADSESLEGGNHSFWGFSPERSSAVPRHRPIDFRLARKICKDPRTPPPSGAR